MIEGARTISLPHLEGIQHMLYHIRPETIQYNTIQYSTLTNMLLLTRILIRTFKINLADNINY